MIIWIASYPKSGNTWVRSIISSLIYSKDGNFTFEFLKKINQFPSTKYFETFTNKFQNINEIMKYWIVAQERINLNKKINFLKTHHINCKFSRTKNGKINNYPFTNNANTSATIYIVRDPRNIVTSISNFYPMKINEAKEFLFGRNMLYGDRHGAKIMTLIGNWGENYISWTSNNSNLLLIKYENLIKNPSKEITRIINFLKKFIDLKVNEKKITNICETTSFENLQKLEKKGKFTENSINKYGKKIIFFNLGEKNDWKNILDKKIRIQIEKKFKKELESLGYLS